MPIKDSSREEKLIKALKEKALDLGIDDDLIETVWRHIIEHSRELQ